MSGLYKFLSLNTYDLSVGSSNNSIIVNKFVAHALICYESIFSHDALVRNPNVNFIVNVSNDGWFGNSLAPYQHLDSLVMRSLENQRFSIRSANTGISMVIDQFGNIQESLELNQRGVIEDIVIFPSEKITFYVRYGDYLIYIMMIILLIVNQWMRHT